MIVGARIVAAVYIWIGFLFLCWSGAIMIRRGWEREGARLERQRAKEMKEKS